MLKAKKPFIIVFEGIDGAGKSTQSKILFKLLKGKINTKLLQEPGSTEVGSYLRNLLKSTKLNPKTQTFLIEASRNMMIEEHIKNFEGVIILDRYYHSTIAYQGYGMGLDISFLKALNEFACTHDNIFYKEDIVFLFDISPEEAIKRIDKKDVYENIELLEKVRKGYLSLAKEHNFHIIDATKPKEYITEYIYNTINKLIKI